MIKNFKTFDKIEFLNKLNLNFNDFNLSENQFDSPTKRHGINHTFRVMLSCLMIGHDLKDIMTTRRSFMAAYIHDMARSHDHWCNVHGRRSIDTKFPIYEELFIKNGSTQEDLEAIKLAIINHSERHEIEKNNPYYKTVALLRDADGLDLVRTDMTVNPNILRFQESIKYIPVVEKLYIDTDDNEYINFSEFMKENMKYYENI